MATHPALEQAYQWIREGRTVDALTLLVPIVKTDRGNADAWWLLANALQNDPVRARDALKQVLRLRPNDVRARRLYARLKTADPDATFRRPVSPAAPPPDYPTDPRPVESWPSGWPDPDDLTVFSLAAPTRRLDSERARQMEDPIPLPPPSPRPPASPPPPKPRLSITDGMEDIYAAEPDEDVVYPDDEEYDEYRDDAVDEAFRVDTAPLVSGIDSAMESNMFDWETIPNLSNEARAKIDRAGEAFEWEFGSASPVEDAAPAAEEAPFPEVETLAPAPVQAEIVRVSDSFNPIDQDDEIMPTLLLPPAEDPFADLASILERADAAAPTETERRERRRTAPREDRFSTTDRPARAPGSTRRGGKPGQAARGTSRVPKPFGSARFDDRVPFGEDILASKARRADLAPFESDRQPPRRSSLRAVLLLLITLAIAAGGGYIAVESGVLNSLFGAVGSVTNSVQATLPAAFPDGTPDNETRPASAAATDEATPDATPSADGTATEPPTQTPRTTATRTPLPTRTASPAPTQPLPATLDASLQGTFSPILGGTARPTSNANAVRQTATALATP